MNFEEAIIIMEQGSYCTWIGREKYGTYRIWKHQLEFLGYTEDIWKPTQIPLSQHLKQRWMPVKKERLLTDNTQAEENLRTVLTFWLNNGTNQQKAINNGHI